MSDEYDRLIFLVLGLLIYMPIKYFICLMLDYINNQPNSISSSTFTFIVCLVIMIYMLKLGLQIFWISSYNLKYCFLITIGFNLLLFMLYLTTNGLGAYDTGLEWAILDYKKLLTIIVGKDVPDNIFNVKTVLIIILIINVVLTLISIPAVIKFGNWYTKTLKEIYYDDREAAKIVDPVEREEH